MNAESMIRELVQSNLADNHHVNGVRFIDQLLSVVFAVGEIRCTLASDCKLRFQVRGQATHEVDLDRAKAKLRMLCARLGVLCNESGDEEVSLYGWDGVIKKTESSDVLQIPSPTTAVDDPSAAASHSAPSSLMVETRLKTWAVRFKNTMSEQEFTIQAL